MEFLLLYPEIKIDSLKLACLLSAIPNDALPSNFEGEITAQIQPGQH
ncbi:MAG: hypothetical protein IPO64_11880 [Bacteroidetes bacterium]|nr:hypothetical protein [Bacteroidota bacterium]